MPNGDCLRTWNSQCLLQLLMMLHDPASKTLQCCTQIMSLTIRFLNILNPKPSWSHKNRFRQPALSIIIHMASYIEIMSCSSPVTPLSPCRAFSCMLLWLCFLSFLAQPEINPKSSKTRKNNIDLFFCKCEKGAGTATRSELNLSIIRRRIDLPCLCASFTWLRVVCHPSTPSKH